VDHGLRNGVCSLASPAGGLAQLRRLKVPGMGGGGKRRDLRAPLFRIQSFSWTWAWIYLVFVENAYNIRMRHGRRFAGRSLETN
jgi:hypothetical protein